MNENLELQTNDESSNNQSINNIENKKSYGSLYEWRHKTQSRLFLSVLQVFGFIFACYILVFQIIFIPIIVNGASMQPTINVRAAGSEYNINTDIVFYHKYNSYKYKDIVIIYGNYAKDSDKIIKRVIACPGQTIKFVVEEEKDSQYQGIKKFFDTSVYVDGVKLQEDYIKEIMSIKFFDNYVPENKDITYYKFYDEFMNELDSKGWASYTLNSDEYFCMGDNRNNSTDSRYFGPVKASSIQGKVVIHVPYGTSLFMVIWDKIFG